LLRLTATATATSASSATTLSAASTLIATATSVVTVIAIAVLSPSLFALLLSLTALTAPAPDAAPGAALVGGRLRVVL
jgi:hypothetical protein